MVSSHSSQQEYSIIYHQLNNTIHSAAALNKSCTEINHFFSPRFKFRLDKIQPERRVARNSYTRASLCNLAVFVASTFLGRRSQMVSVYFLYSSVLRESWPYFHFPTAWAFGLLQNSRKNFLQENNIWHPFRWLSEGAVYERVGQVRVNKVNHSYPGYKTSEAKL